MKQSLNNRKCILFKLILQSNNCLVIKINGITLDAQLILIIS